MDREVEASSIRRMDSPRILMGRRRGGSMRLIRVSRAGRGMDSRDSKVGMDSLLMVRGREIRLMDSLGRRGRGIIRRRRRVGIRGLVMVGIRAVIK